ncbi:MAG: ATP-binding protein [Burkholderiaceae bacterium]
MRDARAPSDERDESRVRDPGRDREVLAELVRLHMRVLLRLPFVMLALVAFLGLVIRDKVSGASFAGWALATLLCEGGRALYARATLPRLDQRDPVRVHRWLMLMALAAGAAQSLMALLFMPQLSLLDQSLVGIVLFALPAAGVAVSMSSRHIIAAYSLAVVLPSTLMWGWLHPEHRLSVILMGALYCGVLIGVAVAGERLLQRSVVIRKQRDRMVLDLERKNAEVRAAMAEAERSSQARARVLAAASHDLRQPLHALSVYSAILAARPDPGTLQEVGRSIDQIVRSFGGLLNGMLDLSRLSAGYYVPERQPLALDRVVGEVCAEFGKLAASKGLRFDCDLKPLRLHGDAAAVGRIARNLIDNAIKYTEAGSVRVQVGVVSGLATLVVSDTGKGIAPDDHGRIFEEFYQVNNPGRDRSQGVGLGLAIVQRLCELTGATIALDSAPGAGSRFVVCFGEAGAGLADAAAAGADPAAEQTGLPLLDGAGRRVFVIDDEADILASTSALLRLWGLQAFVAASAEAAQRLFEMHGRPDLVMADLRLSGDEHGTALASRLRRSYGDFPVLIMTGETSSEALRSANQSGYPLLQKPVAPEVLRDAIRRLLQRSA